ncbi:hypothetical protein RN001_009665 [Aquatica leii]|uniref:Kinesin-like protein n=1 Tax=Aquatica leii TaxID=1421715 RepID=A0AAN7PTZ9_9COLE|nr:hypothetical protein RN001_009665 [Aquatica leii]
MVKNKRELKSPRKNRAFMGSRTGARIRPNVANTQPTGNINVVIRVRPLQERDNATNNKNVLKILDEHTIIFDPKEDDNLFFYHGVQQKSRDFIKRANRNLNFTFDHVFGDNSTNEIVFESSTKCLIETLMKGYNCSVFVYGATGAGKTHTMLGSEQDPGITLLTLKELFIQKEALQHEREFEIGITYLEVYNEMVQDLLNPGIPLLLREDEKYGLLVVGIKMHRIEQYNTLFELLEQGNRNRTQHPTDANTESSRSHAVFQVYLRMKVKATNEISMSKLSMIDLAGSERGASTGYSGARFTEGANINKSLLALGNCINSLADGRRHVPYRDSKLTRLLKDSLGGNCLTVMIANISPSSFNYEDTYNTLKYAMRAKKIKASIKKNIVSSESSINHYMELADQLTKENEELKIKLELFEKECNCKTTFESTKVEKINSVLENPKENLEMQMELQKLYDEKKKLEHQILQLENAKKLEALRKQLNQETETNISVFYIEKPEKNQSQTDIVNEVDQQTLTTQEDIVQLKQRNQMIETEIKGILDKNYQLKLKCEVQNAEIVCMKVYNKADYLQKKCDLQTSELRARYHIIESFSKLLQPCFLQLQEHGLATESLTTEYQELICNLQETRTISWNDNSVESNSDYTPIDPKDELRTPKRKSSDNSNLNNTFVVAEKKASGYNETVKAQVSKTLFDETDGIVMDEYMIADKEDVIDNEVFTDIETSKDLTSTTVHNLCAENKVYTVKSSTADINIPPLEIRSYLQTSSTNLASKRQVTNGYKQSSQRLAYRNGNTTPHQIQKENHQPYSRYRCAKFSDKDKLKPSSARSNTSTGSHTTVLT